jgi:hypothetical protein
MICRCILIYAIYTHLEAHTDGSLNWNRQGRYQLNNVLESQRGLMYPGYLDTSSNFIKYMELAEALSREHIEYQT